MAANTEIRAVLDRIPAGSTVRLELSDGQSIEGTVRGVEGGTVALSNADGVDADEVTDVVIVRRTDGPE